jgi:hypothetical protein
VANNKRLPAWRRPEAKFAKGTEVDMPSYSDLHARIKKQIAEGRAICDRERGTPGDRINEWIKVSKKCLALMENRVPALRGFSALNFHVRMAEEDVQFEVLEEGDHFRSRYWVDEDRWSRSWFRDGGDNPIDFNFSDLQHVVELLELADEKLQLDSEPKVAHGPSPKLPAERCTAGNTQELAGNKRVLPGTELPNGGNGSNGSFGGNGCETVEPLNRSYWVDTFLQRCIKETKLKALKKHIWQAAGHRRARQFQFWQASSPRATASDDANFPRILAMKPTEFETLLKKKGII